MRREGRQHGFVRCYAISPTPSSYQRYVKTVHPSSVAGWFAKVSSKPTNQSKFTGKCGRARCVDCHIRPVSKSKEKAKGTMKLRSIRSDARLIGYPAGTSATDVLDDLAGEAFYDDEDVYYDELYYWSNYWMNCECDDCRGSVEKDPMRRYRDVGLYWGERDADEYGDDGWYLLGRMEQFPPLGKDASFIPLGAVQNIPFP